MLSETSRLGNCVKNRTSIEAVKEVISIRIDTLRDITLIDKLKIFTRFCSLCETSDVQFYLNKFNKAKKKTVICLKILILHGEYWFKYLQVNYIYQR